MSLDLDPDFAEFVECLARRSVRYLVVGGYALAAHGLPRATGDLDVWVMVDPANARNVMQRGETDSDGPVRRLDDVSVNADGSISSRDR